MKKLFLLVFGITTALLLPAQNTSPIPEITKQLTEYFSYNPDEKVSFATDKLQYKPGETIWFSARVSSGNQQLVSPESQELFVKLYDKNGRLVVQDIFRLDRGFASGDILIPESATKDFYFLFAQASSQEISAKIICIDPEYRDQWVASSHLKDSISTAGQKNEIALTISNLSGEIQKKETVRYQIMNGTEMLENGKLKTDENGKVVIPFTLPAKTNGEPFMCKITDNRDEWSREVFLPTNFDPVIVRFFPEGGNLNVGIPAKVGFTAFNKWGIPVDVEGSLVNQDGKNVALVKSFTKGLGLFSVLNDGSQKYKLVLSGKTGSGQSFELPDPKPDGLALSVLKSDAGFISANLIFADKQKHPIALAITSESRLNWAADMEINGMGRIKIPDETLPQGINLLSVFSAEGQLMAERILYVDKKQQLKIEVVPEKTKLQPGENMKVKVQMKDEKDQPIAGNITVTVSDQFRNDPTGSSDENYGISGQELETPFSLISGAMKGRAVNSVLQDAFLIANHLKGFDWQKIRNFKPGNSPDLKAKSKDSEVQVSNFIASNALKYSLANADHSVDKTYFSNNPGLFVKTPGKANPNTNSLDNQRRLLASTTSLLEVIKILKPYKLVNNQLVFIGMDNSLNYQGGALFVVDGVQLGTDISSILGISPLSVDHINISTNVMDIHKYTGFNTIGVIEIFMKKGPIPEPEAQKENPSKYNDGFRIPNIFPTESANLKSDTRTTLQWIPNQNIDETGQFEFTVSAGKVISDFVIEVQGISGNGRAGSGKGIFSVAK